MRLLLFGCLLVLAGCRGVAAYSTAPPWAPEVRSLWIGECECKIMDGSASGWGAWNVHPPSREYCGPTGMGDANPGEVVVLIGNIIKDDLAAYCASLPGRDADLPLAQCVPKLAPVPLRLPHWPQSGLRPAYPQANPPSTPFAGHGACIQPSPEVLWEVVASVPAFGSYFNIDPSLSYMHAFFEGGDARTSVAGVLNYTGGNAYDGIGNAAISINRMAVRGPDRLELPENAVEDAYGVLTSDDGLGGFSGDLLDLGPDLAGGTLAPSRNAVFHFTAQKAGEAERIKLVASSREEQFWMRRRFSSRFFHLEGRVRGKGFSAFLWLEGASANQVPVVFAQTASGALQVPCTSVEDGANVQMLGTVLDPDDDNTWQRAFWYRKSPGGAAELIATNTLTPWVALPIGQHRITLYVEDGAGGAAYRAFDVEVVEPCH